jgi:integrase
MPGVAPEQVRPALSAVVPRPPHELRHTAASLAVSAGANVKAVQRMLGHASAAMTLDVYSGLFDDDLDGVAAKLDQECHPIATREPRGEVIELRPSL